MTTPSIYTIIAVCVSILALSITAKNYRRKSGIYLRGSFSIGSSIACNDEYITGIILENFKDRAVTIFAIYLKVGHNYYIEVENLEDKPFVLRAYETYQKEFGPIEFYGINSNKINLNSLLKDNKIKKQLVLSTSGGKYKVPSNFRRWNPIWEFFQNHMTAVVRPVRSIYKDKSLGGNIKYVIEFTSENGNEEIVPVHPRDYELKIFRAFKLTKESLESKEALEKLLENQMQNGNLSCKKYIVYDLQKWRERAHELYTGKTLNAEYYNRFQYYVMGKVITKYSDRKLKRENARRNRVSSTKQDMST